MQLANDFRKHGIPDAISDATQMRARRETCAIETPYGPVVQPVELPLASGTVSTYIQHPLAMLYHACNEGGAFLDFMRSKVQRFPSTQDKPWGFIFYNDGVGMKLLDHDARKCEACYWSFVEFGRPTLNCEQGWFVVGAPRSTLIHELPGGMSHYMAILLRLLFHKDRSVTDEGFFLPIGDNGSQKMMFITLHVVVADEVALKSLFHFRGASARLPCGLCINATALKGNVPRSPFFRPITCLSFSEFVPNTKAGVRACLAHLADCATRMGPSAFTEEQRKLGWTHSPFNVLLDESLDVDVCASMMLDWFHLFLVSGIFGFEFALFMRLWGTVDLGFPSLCVFLSKWVWPRPRTKPWKAFENPVTEEGNLKCSASDILSLYPVIALYVQQILRPLGRFKDQVDSFLALCDVLDILWSLNRGIHVAADILEAAIVNHFTLYQNAYGDLEWVWKHHGCLHLAQFLRKFGYLLALFTQERRHRIIKRFLHGRKNLKSFERGVIEEITCEHLRHLKDGWLKAGLQHASCNKRTRQSAKVRELYPHAAEVATSSEATLADGSFFAGDVAFVQVHGRIEVCEIWFHFQVDNDEPHSLVSLWATAGETDRYTRWVKRGEHPVDIRTKQLRDAGIFRRFDDDSVIVLVPPVLR